jgi:1-phosphatidylinositol-4-phosphate 5-kinase
VDLLLASLYIFQYCATEYAANPVALPFRIAALTQALLVCGEFWFFAIPIDLVQSITNPFTSYAHNFRVYWVYSTLSGTACGFILWCLDDDASDASSTHRSRSSSTKEDQRFFWFHHNTDMPGFFWHRWILYHVWVLVYLLFGVYCITFLQRRLRRGLEETFDVRRHILSNGIFTCVIYISWSLTILCLFALSNVAAMKDALPTREFRLLINVSAFFHAARGCVNIVVWLVVNGSLLSSLSSCSHAHYPQNQRKAVSRTDTSASSMSQGDEHELLLNPQLNRALQRQIVHMATSGIIESVQHYQSMHQRIQSNQTFDLDWECSKQRDLLLLSSSESLGRSVRDGKRTSTTTTATIQVVGARVRTSTPRFSFLPVAMKEMQFYDFQPRVFASIRLLYGVDDAEYMFAFRSTMNERISEGRSGAFVFNTCDRKYLVKSMTSEEKSVLLELLPSYLRYLKWNPHKLLPRFLGFHAMKMYGQIFYFVVMGNILSTPEPIHRRYDIKGS